MSSLVMFMTHPTRVFASALAWLGLWALGSAAARAACPDLPDPQMRELDAMVTRNAKHALSEIQDRLHNLEASTQAHPAQLAELYALQASAYSMLELDQNARAAASKGLQLAPQPSDPVHVNLLIGYWQNIYDQAGLDQAVTEFGTARKAQAPGSSADICLLTARGIVQMRRDRPDLAIADLTQAYRATMAPSLAGQRVLAATALASLMRDVGDFDQALALNQEAIDWDDAHDATLDLSVARFLRGETYSAMGNYAGALDQFTQARALSIAVDDDQGVAFADQATCRAHIELGQLVLARSECEQALRVFLSSHTTDVIKETQAQMASIDLAEGHPERALLRLNTVLENDGSDMPARELANIYHLRARTSAQLHDYTHAYQDLDTYMRRYTAANDAERTRQIATLRAQLETDRAIEHSGVLQRELVLSRERSGYQAAELRRNHWMTAGGVSAIALLSYMLLVNRRNRHMLVRLASFDGLTGLPNRRRTSELAREALSEANETARPLTIALLDFDHFKEINDRCGHAAGDYVLQEFARHGQLALRTGDILGRWGGEEFLLVLPDCRLDSAFEIVERLRAIAMQIQLSPAKPIRVSVSAGLATNVDRVVSLDEIVASADAALYEAKAAGRDLVRIARASVSAASTGTRRALPQELTSGVAPAARTG